MTLHFPPGFRWGVSTAAYSIEGAWNEGGKGESIWDHFAHDGGRIADGSTGDTACDHYHHYLEDITLMAGLGVGFYRFSISWPRVLPRGRGTVNHRGLDFYSRLVDALLDRGIEPLPVLYQWDLPQALQDEGGWENVETANLFAEYAAVVHRGLGDRVRTWVTHNEPFVPSFVSYYEGAHPPGVRDMGRAIDVSRQILLSHGLAVQALRSLDGAARLGLSTILFPVHPASGVRADREAAHRYDGYLHRWFLDPLFKGAFPEDMLNWYRGRGLAVPQLSERESRLCSQPLDFLALCYFSRFRVAEGDDPYLAARVVEPPVERRNEMGWEIYPQGMYEILQRVHYEYGPREILVSENGIPLPDRPEADGGLHDPGRSQFLARCLAGVHRAIQEGIPVSGYSVWSLLDNLEWDLGLSKRFGLVYVDYHTLARVPKDSYGWYRTAVRTNSIGEGKRP